MTLEEKIRGAIDDMDTAEAVDIWNNYRKACNLCDDVIYSMSEFDEVMEYESPWRIARACCYGDFCAAHKWFWFNIYGNLESSDFPIIDGDSPFSLNNVVDYIVENNDPLYNDEIQEILDEEDEEETK